jgi:alpha-1,3-rhamnosyl/mannosyltransferase
MRVVVNNLTAIRQKSGIGHHVSELLRCLRDRHPDDEFIAFPGACVATGMRVWSTVRHAIGRLRRSGSVSSHKARREKMHALARGWAAWHFRAALGHASFDLYHEPNHVPLPCDRPTVTTVHDLSVLLHPQWHPADRVAYFAQHFAAGLARCSHLLAVSEFTRCELIATFNVPAERVTCTYNGIRPELRPMPPEAVRPVRERLGLPAQYLLHVGTLEPRKNLLLLMQAYGDLPARVRERCPLVLAGGWGWNAAEVFTHYHDVARHRGVHLLGYVSDADLPAVYNGAHALVFPSHYEGFGLPPLEMLACGGAVIASTAGAVVETAGQSAHLIDAGDLAGWRDAMHRIVTDDDWHARLCRGGPAVARTYTWERCAEETYRVYERVLGPGVPARRAA